MSRPIPTESDIPMHGWSPYSDMHRERIRAHDLHHNPPAHFSQEYLTWDHASWTRVVGEEFGEVCRVLNEYELGNASYDETLTNLRKELIQLGAMGAAWIDAVDGAYFAGRIRPDGR